MPNWKKVIVSGSDAALNSLYAPSITGSLLGTASFALFAANVLNTQYGYIHTQNISSVSWSINHNLQSTVPIVQIYNSSYQQLIPSSITATNQNTVDVVFAVATTGFAIISKGSGLTTAIAVSASYAINAETASYALSSQTYKTSIIGSAMYTITHNLNEEYPFVQVYNAVDKQQTIPSIVRSENVNQIYLEFATAFSGSVLIKK